jgi:hypothetical protein
MDGRESERYLALSRTGIKMETSVPGGGHVVHRETRKELSGSGEESGRRRMTRQQAVRMHRRVGEKGRR